MKKIIVASLLICLGLGASCVESKTKLNTDEKKQSYALGSWIGQDLKARKPNINIKSLKSGLSDGLKDKSSLTDEQIIASIQSFEMKTEDSDEVKNQSYAVGNYIGKDLLARELDVEIKYVKKGIDAGSKGESQLNAEEIQAALHELEHAAEAKYKEKVMALRMKNLKESEAFLKDNKTKENIIELESGLQYRVVQEGSGQSPTKTDTVVVHYRGTLINGKEFDSSYKRGTPAEFRVDQVIPGWTEALQSMTPGSKWELYIPPHLGYGIRGTGGDIEPNAALIFEVELLDVKN